jgi:TRAP-type C4-dicarboxylate transport system permease large subunit
MAASFLLGTLTMTAVRDSFIQAAKLTGVIFSLLVSAAAINFLAALSGLPELVGEWASSLNLSLPGFVVLMLAVFLVCGMFLDTQVALVLVAPILAPAAYALGGDPVHLGIVICLTISLGLITPPIGGAILVVTSVTATPYGRLMRATLPFVIVEFLLILFFALCPEVVMALPRLINA